MKFFAIKIVLLAFVATHAHVCIYSQIQGEEFSERVSAKDRIDIFNRLTLYERYQREHRWKSFYDLLYEKRDKRQFVSKQKASPNDGAGFTLIRFHSPNASFPDDSTTDWLIIEGCATIVEADGKKRKVGGFVNVYRLKGQWLFSMLELMRPVGGDLKSCSVSPKGHI